MVSLINPPFTVTFDSNVWECIVDPAKREGVEVNQRLFQLIKSGAIIPFFFEGIATVEAVPKSERITFFPNARPRISIKIGDGEPRVTEGTPAPKLTPYLNQNIPIALNLGFSFIRLPRVGAPRVPEEFLAPDKYVALEERLKRSIEFARFIEALGLGRAEMETKTSILRELAASKNTLGEKSISAKAYAKDVSEWSDGDALAAHYGYGLDYFCTNDRGKNAGLRSVFSESNLVKLKEHFAIKVLGPDQLLVALEQHKNNA